MRADAPVFLPNVLLAGLANQEEPTQQLQKSPKKGNGDSRRRKDRGRYKGKRNSSKPTSDVNPNHGTHKLGHAGKCRKKCTRVPRQNRRNVKDAAIVNDKCESQHKKGRNREEKKNRKKTNHITLSADRHQAEKKIKDNTESLLDYDTFPSLESAGDLKIPFLNISSSENKWSSIAHEGHVYSESVRAHDKKEHERIKHELETHTRMEVLSDKTKANFDQSVLKESYVFRDDGKGDTDNSSFATITYSSKVGTVLAKKLKDRWFTAFEEWQVQEEIRRVELEKIQEHIILEQNHAPHQILHEEIDSDDDPISQEYIIESELHSQLSSVKSKTDHVYLEEKYPLHSAIISNDEAAVKDLILLPPQTTLRDDRVSANDLMLSQDNLSCICLSRLKTKLSAMHLALVLNRPNIVKVLLSCSYQLNSVTSICSLDDQDDCKRTPLMLAAEFALDDCLKVLLAYGPKIALKHQHSGDCVLHIACRHAEPSTVELLVSRERSSSRKRLLCCRNRFGETPLHIIASRGRLDILKLLLKICTTTSEKALTIIDRSNRTPLLIAISKGYTEIVMHVLTYRGNHAGSTSKLICSKFCPLTIAVSTKSLEMIYVILECRTRSTFGDYNYTSALREVIFCFDSCSHDAYEIIELLIEEGADPYCKISSNVSRDFHSGNTVLEMAANKGLVKIVAKMMDLYEHCRRRRMKLLREDPILYQQPDSYFTAILAKEEREIQNSIGDIFIRLLKSSIVDGETSYRKLGSCLSIIRRGSCMNDDKFVSLLRILMSDRENITIGDALAPDKAIFLGQYDHFISHCPDKSVSHNSPYVRSTAQGWTLLFLRLNWAKEYISKHELACLNLKEEITSQNQGEGRNTCQDDFEDTCIFVVEGLRLKAHKSILCKKSPKIEAAIRFAEMRNDYGESLDPDHNIEVQLDISLLNFFLLVCHCYHGSIIAGLDSRTSICCQQLLDLLFVANEYLCSSLAQECELRILSRNPYKCHCWSCCEKLAIYDHDKFCMRCCYSVQGPSRLLSVDNYLNIISSITGNVEIDTGSYTITRRGTANFKDALFPPLSILSSILWKGVLLNFRSLLKTDSYISLYHSTMADDESARQTSSYLECFGDQIGILLLDTVLDELNKVPSDLVFMTPLSKSCSHFKPILN
uniref:BTB domain-containing protein n=1 Tax=Chaetoceros debilis TaxID=122233 RepID=A0A7S3Q892_9STRA